MRKILAPIALFCLAIPATAQAPEAPGKADPTRIAAGTYQVDPAHTVIAYEVNHFGFNDYYGLFGDATGTLTIDPARPQDAKVDITIPMSGIVNTSQKLTDHLKTPDFFDAAKHPTARFVSTRVEVDPQNSLKAKIHGNLTIRGVTRPVVLDAEFTGAGLNPMNKKATIGFEAETEIKRSEFGVSYGLGLVSDEVELDISVAFEKA